MDYRPSLRNRHTSTPYVTQNKPDKNPLLMDHFLCGAFDAKISKNTSSSLESSCLQWETLGFSYQVLKETLNSLFGSTKKGSKSCFELKILKLKVFLKWLESMKHAVEASGSYEFYSASDSFDRIQSKISAQQRELRRPYDNVPSSWLLTTGTVDVVGSMDIENLGHVCNRLFIYLNWLSKNTSLSTWWLTLPIQKDMLVKLHIFLKDWSEKTYIKAPRSCLFVESSQLDHWPR